MKIKIDTRFKTINRGIYGIFTRTTDNDLEDICCYVGKSEQLAYRAEQHKKSLLNKTHIPTLNSAMDDEKSTILIKLIESVPYEFDNYYKDAQRLASRENYWIDKYQKNEQCLEQLPSGKRPSLMWWESEKDKLGK